MRIFYRVNGKNRYTIVARTATTRSDEFRWIMFTSELLVRTGLIPGDSELGESNRSLGGL